MNNIWLVESKVSEECLWILWESCVYIGKSKLGWNVKRGELFTMCTTRRVVTLRAISNVPRSCNPNAFSSLTFFSNVFRIYIFEYFTRSIIEAWNYWIIRSEFVAIKMQNRLLQIFTGLQEKLHVLFTVRYHNYFFLANKFSFDSKFPRLKGKKKSRSSRSRTKLSSTSLSLEEIYRIFLSLIIAYLDNIDLNILPLFTCKSITTIIIVIIIITMKIYSIRKSWKLKTA